MSSRTIDEGGGCKINAVGVAKSSAISGITRDAEHGFNVVEITGRNAKTDVVEQSVFD